MPIFFQQQITPGTRLAIWKIEETEEYFLGNVPLHREVKHPHKRLQHLAGRFLLQFLFPDFPYELIRVADTRKPFLEDALYSFSISHCGDYAAALVSRDTRTGIDVELNTPKIEQLREKFLSPAEIDLFAVAGAQEDLTMLTRLWSAKEAVFKWYGEGGVDFSDQIRLLGMDETSSLIRCQFTKTGTDLEIHYRSFHNLQLTWVLADQ